MRQVAADTEPPADLIGFLRPGSRLADRFRVEGFARRGGMGSIYRGIDSQTQQPIAIKTVGRVARGTSARFAREIAILAEQSHPHVVQYLSHGVTAEGALYLVMEWLEGEDLAERLRRAPLSLEDSLSLLRRVCGGLSGLHARGIVHRDIKPANLFLPKSDPRAVKVLDFGIARVVEDAHLLTTDGVRIGTVGYMSPEQAMGEVDVDARADVFALGCVFYECLTGRAPFASSHAVAILAKVLQEEPTRPSELVAEAGPAIDDFVSRLLAKNRNERPADATAVLELFDDLQAQSSSAAPKLRPSLSPRRTDQKIVSVILGRGQGGIGAAALDVDSDEHLSRVSAKFGARVMPLKGGGVLLVLSGRGEANDRASQAALCALELATQRPELTLAVATGLADTSGSVPVGSAIDRAAALLGEADVPSRVLLDEVTLGLVGLRFEVQRVGNASVLLAARRDFDGPRVLMGRTTPHVGRDRELRMLDEALNECVVERVSRPVIVMGPPGIGKSRLASEWLSRGGRGGGVRTLFARGDPIAAGSAWSLLKLLIRDAAGLREADPREAQFARLREHMTRLLGPVACERPVEFLAEIIGVRNQQPPSQLLLAARNNPDVMQEQVRRALHDWLDVEALSQPLLLVLEDVHWGDTPSVAFLSEALRDKPHRPLMVLALARPEVERQFPEFCERAVLRLRLPGLGVRAAQQLIDFALGDGVDQDIVARLMRVTDGNPFYLEELIRRVATGNDDWPETVLAMAQSRIDQLDPEMRCVLLAASVFGERCWNQGVKQVLDGAVRVDDVLKRLTGEELLLTVEDSRYAGTREYRFRHALFRDAAYAMLTRDDRVNSHGIAAEWLERHLEKDARLLADHYEAAEARERAIPWLMKAAKKAIDAGDTLAAIELANRGIALGAQGVDRARFLMLRSYAEAIGGSFNLELTREALELLPVGTPLWWLAVAVMVFGAAIIGRAEEALPYIDLAAQAPFAWERDVPLGQGLVTLVGGLVLFGRPDVAEVILERARENQSESRDEPVFDAFLTAAECALEAVAPVGGRWRLEQALKKSRFCAATLGALGALHGQTIVLYYLAVAAMHLGLHEEARDACLRACQNQRQLGSRIRDAWPFLFLARAYLRLGQPEEAIRAVEPIRTSADRNVHQMLPVVLGEAELRRGDPEAARAAVAPSFSGKSPRLRRLAAAVLARAELALGHAADALSTIESVAESGKSNGLESDVELLNVNVECLLALGMVGRAREVAARAQALVVGLAADIEDPELRRSFLENVEPCARALTLYGQLS